MYFPSIPKGTPDKKKTLVCDHHTRAGAVSISSAMFNQRFFLHRYFIKQDAAVNNIFINLKNDFFLRSSRKGTA